MSKACIKLNYIYCGLYVQPFNAHLFHSSYRSAILDWTGEFWAHQSIFHVLCVVSTLLLFFSSLWQLNSSSNIFHIHVHIYALYALHALHICICAECSVQCADHSNVPSLSTCLVLLHPLKQLYGPEGSQPWLRTRKNRCISKQQKYQNGRVGIMWQMKASAWAWTKVGPRKEATTKSSQFCVKAKAVAKAAQRLKILSNRIWSFLRINKVCMQHFFTNSTDISHW